MSPEAPHVVMANLFIRFTRVLTLAARQMCFKSYGSVEFDIKVSETVFLVYGFATESYIEFPNCLLSVQMVARCCRLEGTRFQFPALEVFFYSTQVFVQTGLRRSENFSEMVSGMSAV